MIEPALLFGGRYELGPVIGRGGMAEVRSARDTRLDREVAVKLLRPEMAHQPGVRDRFESEARLAARLNHPNVVAVFDSGEEDGVPYIVMERLPGQTLQDRMAGGPMDPDEVRAMAVQVLGALQAAHEAGVLHRDVKPGNILAAAGARWKVGDFGIAKALEVGRSDLTSTGLLVGTPAYVAPERLLGSPATVASDLYSLGVVLYEALAGCKPFDIGGADGWAAPVTGPAPVLAAARLGVDPDLAEAVERCLARDPADRYWSAAEMEARLAGGPGAGRPGRAGGPGRAGSGSGPAPAPVDPTARLGRTTPTEVFPMASRAEAYAPAPVGARAKNAGGRSQGTRTGPGRFGFSRAGRGRAGISRAGFSRAGWGLVAAAVAVVVIMAVALSGRGSSGTGTTATTATTATTPAPTSAPTSAPAGPTSAPGGTQTGGQGLPAGLNRALDNLRHQVSGGH